ncbi:MAG: hypothetical protein ACYDG6_04785 [Thermincolia bacterium]
MLKKINIGVVLMALLMLFNTSAAWAADTKDDSKISVDIHHYLLSYENGNLAVKEVLRFNNTGTDTFIGTGNKVDGKNAVLTVSLPAGQTGLNVTGVNPNSYVVKDNVLYTTQPLAPGKLELRLNYTLPPSNGQFKVTSKVNYPTNTVYVLSSPQGVVIEAVKLLQAIGMQDFQGSFYQVLMGQGLAKGSEMEIGAKPGSVEVPAPGAQTAPGGAPDSTAGTSSSLWIPFAVIAGVALIIIIVIVLKNRQRGASYGDDGEYDQLLKKENRLTAKLTDLEEQLNKGEIEYEEYEELNKKYKKMLAKVKLQIKELEDEEEFDEAK